MEFLTPISIIVGIIVGLLAILEKFFKIFSKNKFAKRKIEEEYEVWKNSDYNYSMKLDDLKKVIGYVKRNKLNDEMEAFILTSVLQHGGPSLNELLQKNCNNKQAIAHIFNMLKGKGVRVGWRAEYALTKVNHDFVNGYFEKLPDEVKNDGHYKNSIQRINNNDVINYLNRMKESDDKKLKSYAFQVLDQITTRNTIYDY